MILVLGITSLVGILTAIDGIENRFTESMSSLGANSFDIYSKWNRGSAQDGVKEKMFAPLKLSEMQKFIAQYSYPATISLSATLTILAEVKHGSEKTNPNVNVKGANEEYLSIKGLNLESGRNFSTFEIQQGGRVAIIGNELSKTLFGEGKDPVNSVISFKGAQFKVIGKMKEKGAISENNFDNMMIIPIIVANQLAGGVGLNYRLNVGVTDASQLDFALGEATGAMRKIRRDEVGKPNSFEIEKSDSLAELQNVTGNIRAGGFVLAFITLLGASIAMMNIMLVSVTERTREIGVRKALGATPLRIRQQFLIEAIVICLMGGFLGIVIGIFSGNGVAKLTGASTFIVPWFWIFVGFLVCVGVGLISGYYPAHKASKLDPIESLRFE
jgi:putative ABC transport system permease protein